MHFVGADSDTFPSGIGFGGLWQPINLKPRESTRFQYAYGFAQVGEDHVGAGNVLEHRVRVDEIEVGGRELREVAAAGVVRVRPGDVTQFFACLRDHFIGDVDAVDLAEVAAHGTHEAAWSAADLEGAARGRCKIWRKALELAFQI